MRWTSDAVTALQEATEAYTMTRFKDSNLVVIHSKRVIFMPKDMQLIWQLHRETQDDIEGVRKGMTGGKQGGK